ncbi:hypothetical protein C8R44DRAFT_984767 [Mycena epipterygia]|nr:hypothetical protein C8R44DRAFT_984767 [Mycena epipterygia]
MTSNVPTLKPNGENFTIFSARFPAAVDAKGYMGHFTGTAARPAARKRPNSRNGSRPRVTQGLAPQKVPNPTVITINAMPTVSEMRTCVKKTYYTSKGAYIMHRLPFARKSCSRNDLLQRVSANFLVRSAFVARRWHLWVSITISEDEYLSIKNHRLPSKMSFFSDFASSLLTSVRLVDPVAPCAPYIRAISEEYERKAVEKKQGGKGEDERDGALAGEERLGRLLELRHHRAIYFARECKKPGDSASTPKTRGGGLGTGAPTARGLGRRCCQRRGWFNARSAIGSEVGRMRVASSEPDCSSSEESFGIDRSASSSFVDVDPTRIRTAWDRGDALSTATQNEAAAVITREVKQVLTTFGVVRLGHNSPPRWNAKFRLNFVPRSVSAANKPGFSAGHGDMVLDIPNGVDVSKLQLCTPRSGIHHLHRTSGCRRY